ncbi:MAG: hypothetical protein Q9219_005830 [cf. Caloplaca sp. 3 TL-2023]
MDPLPEKVLRSLYLETTKHANGSVIDDPFYRVPEEATGATPGSMIKVEGSVDTSKYLLPPATALSRIMYQTENHNGHGLPASAYILWPYSPRSQRDGYQVVVWAHGTSGINASGAPSNHRSLFQDWFMPFQLAVNGYVVVAPDYAGLGVDHEASGVHIVHEYLALASHANDIVFAAKAARDHFTELSKEFVVVGQSQGGGAAWATARRQHSKPITGYLGAVAISPVVDLPEQLQPGLKELIGVAMCPGIKSVLPGFEPGSVLTEEGQKRLALVQSSGARLSSSFVIAHGAKLMKDGWTENSYMQEYCAMSSLGGKEIAGPLLVIHGEEDRHLDCGRTVSAALDTSKAFPLSSISCVVIPNIMHDPAMPASQKIWMDWIADRFAGQEPKTGYSAPTYTAARPPQDYLAERNWCVAPAADDDPV